MKTVYVNYLSEDGLDVNLYSNIKALYFGLIATGYRCLTIGYLGQEVPFTYNNLVKKLNESSKGNTLYKRALINCGGSTIEVTEMPIKSK